MSPMVTKHVSLSVLKIQPEVMGSWFYVLISQLYTTHTTVCTCVSLYIRYEPNLCNIFVKFILNVHISCNYSRDFKRCQDYLQSFSVSGF